MPAPKGNKNAVGNNGGRPPIHTDVEEVDNLIEKYFEYIKGEKFEGDHLYVDEQGETKKEKKVFWIREPEPPTVTGLALHLNFNSKTTLYEYAEKIEFANSIKRALTKIEQYHEIRASYGDKCTGNIFVLKNFGWKDTQAIDHSNKGDKFGESDKIREAFLASIKMNDSTE